MSNLYRFSVIIPTYNRCYVLWRAIQSVLRQTFPYFELIIIDDGSQDDTAKLAQQFTDPRLRYFSLKKNKGASAARNVGLKKAKGELIAYLDSDNIWHNDFLEVMDKAFRRQPKKILGFCKKNYRLIIQDGEEEKPWRDEFTYTRRYFDLKRLWQRRILIDTNSLVHKRKEILALGGWDEKQKFWEDWELTLRISEKYPRGFFYVNRALVDYEQKLVLDKEGKIFKFWEQEEKKIFKKYKNSPLIQGQNWFPPQEDNKSTLGMISFLRQQQKKKKG